MTGSSVWKVSAGGIDARATGGWSTFLVTAPARVPVARNGVRVDMPAGQAHARQVGASQTLCGRSAVTWLYFWSLSFDPEEPGACLACVAVIQELASAARPATGRQG